MRPPIGSTKNLSIKNTLTAADADLVEAGFPREARDNRVSVHHGRGAITVGAETRHPLLRVKSLFLRRWETQPRSRRPLLEPQPSVVVALRRRPFACATRSTANSSPRSPASSAAERRPMRITFASPSRARSAERSATNTRSRSAGSITANCTATAMKPHGGPGSASIRCRSRSSYGGDRDCRTRRKRPCPSPCPTSRLQRRRSIGRHWTTTPGTGSTWPNILKARRLDD